LHLTGFNFTNYFHRQLDNILIGWRWGAVELGFYSRAYVLLTLPLTIVNWPLGAAVVPALSRLQNDPQRWKSAFLDVLGGATMIGAGIAALLISTADPLIRVVYGDDWVPAISIFTFLAISMFPATPLNAMGWLYISLGKVDRMLRLSVVMTPLIVVGFVIGLPFGGDAVALAYSCVMCVLIGPAIVYAARGSPVTGREIFRVVLPPTTVGVGVTFAMLALIPVISTGLKVWDLAILLSLAGVLYSAGAGLILLADPVFGSLRQRLIVSTSTIAQSGMAWASGALTRQ
jgi:PST family polysaccharide transporter